MLEELRRALSLIESHLKWQALLWTTFSRWAQEVTAVLAADQNTSYDDTARMVVRLGELLAEIEKGPGK